MNLISSAADIAVTAPAGDGAGALGPTAGSAGRPGGGHRQRTPAAPTGVPPRSAAPPTAAVLQGVNTAAGLSQLASVLELDSAALTRAVGSGTRISDLLARTSRAAMSGYFSTQGVQYDARL